MAEEAEKAAKIREAEEGAARDEQIRAARHRRRLSFDARGDSEQFTSRQDRRGYERRALTRHPKGFGSRAKVLKAAGHIHSVMGSAGHDGAQVFMKGSSVSGRRFDRDESSRTHGRYAGKEFDEGRTSDHDYAIVHEGALEAARAKGFGNPEGNPHRTMALHRAELDELGLRALTAVSKITKRKDSNFMLYRNAAELKKRGAYIQLDPDTEHGI